MEHVHFLSHESSLATYLILLYWYGMETAILQYSFGSKHLHWMMIYLTMTLTMID